MNESPLPKPGELGEELHLVKFSSSTCGPCKMLEQKMEGIKEDLLGIALITMNPQYNLEWVQECNIRSIPTVVGFKNNKEVFRVIGNNIEGIKENISRYR